MNHCRPHRLNTPSAHRALLSVLIAANFAVVACAAPTVAPAGSLDVPDGAPALPKQEAVAARSGASADTARGNDPTAIQIREERIQGRLATAEVSFGGRSYVIVDPAAGRFDRQANNGGRRVNPVLWQLFRF